MKKPNVNELTRLAFVWAEQDRLSLADAWPKGTPEQKQALQYATWIREHRLKRWGQTNGDRIRESRTISVSDLLESKKQKGTP